MCPAPRRAVAREARAVMREEAVVSGGEPGGQLELVGVVREPVDPATAEPPLELPDVGRSEARPLEDEHDVDGPLPQAGGEPGGEGTSEHGVPAASPLLAAAHLTPQRRQRRGEGQAAPVVATIECRDQHDPQTRERGGGGPSSPSVVPEPKQAGAGSPLDPAGNVEATGRKPRGPRPPGPTPP